MSSITERVYNLKELIATTARNNHRDPAQIKLCAASKGRSIRAIEEAYQAGLRDFGENHYQEALIKIQALQSLRLCWHFLGPIQSNKAKGVAQHFSWVHSLNRREIADLLNKHRSSYLPALNVCLQINLDQEISKSGISMEEAPHLAAHVIGLPHLKLRGLMAIPFPEQEPEKQYESLLRLKKILASLNQTMGLKLDTLSMGMSNDLVAAIRAGSTIVRIGRALFCDSSEINQLG
jgi:pyridoxal phosphate enzyme (YggS family)